MIKFRTTYLLHYFLLFFNILISLHSYSQTSWIQKLPLRGFPTKMIKTSDNGFACVAVTDFNGYEEKLSLIKCDSSGITQWVKKLSFRDSTYYIGESLIEVPGVGFAVLASFYNSPFTYAPNGLLFFTDLIGDTLWTYSFFDFASATFNNRYSKLQFFDNSSLLVLGGLSPENRLNQFDFSGNLLSTLSDTFSYKYCHLTNDLNGNTIISRVPYSGGTYDFQNIYSLTPSLLHSNDHYYSGMNGEFADVNKLYNDLTYLVASGDTLIKLDGNFDSLWTHPIANYLEPGFTSQTPQDFKALTDGGYVECGKLKNSLVNLVYLLRTDSLGNIQFRQGYNANIDNCVSVIQDNDGGFVMFQSGNPDTTNVPEMWLVKTNSNGLVNVVPEHTIESNLIKVYPNPTSSKLNIEFKETFSGTIFLTDITGKLLFSKRVDSIWNDLFNFDYISDGIYLLNFSDNHNSNRFTSKIIIQHL